MSVAHYLIRLQVRIETIAETHSVPGETGVSLEETLAALTDQGRRRVLMILEQVRAFSDNPDEQAAADHIRQAAEQAWSRRQAR